MPKLGKTARRIIGGNRGTAHWNPPEETRCGEAAVNLYQFAVTVQRDREAAHAHRSAAAEQQQPLTARTQRTLTALERRSLPNT